MAELYYADSHYKELHQIKGALCGYVYPVTPLKINREEIKMNKSIRKGDRVKYATSASYLYGKVNQVIYDSGLGVNRVQVFWDSGGTEWHPEKNLVLISDKE